ncbi:GIY-YIG nuclease family protein [Candidatus Uhrbacteria bacterium]|nr:GIY-YIG nuclease family protein [Candidatus Uhrbacteria bacterium]
MMVRQVIRPGARSDDRAIPPMMYFVYVLRLNNGDLYKGYTEDIERRLKEHERGIVDSTRPFRPLKPVLIEKYFNQSDAMRRERFLKTTEGRRLLHQQLRDTLS